MNNRILLLFLLAGVWSYDYNALAIEWKPSQCISWSCASGYLSTDFNIHGLWPSNWDGSYPSYCSSSPFSILPQTEKLLKTCWVSYSSSDPTNFWEHEWSKHGTCMSPALECNDYLNTTAILYHNKNLLPTLAVYGITPSNTTVYSPTRFLEVFLRKITISCYRFSNTYYLNTLMLCYDHNLNWINCGESKAYNCGSGFKMPLA